MPFSKGLLSKSAGRCATLDDTRGHPSLSLRRRRMRCTKCGTESTTSRKFCAACGCPLSRRCPKCGAENAPSSAFCEDCGAALAGNTASAATGSPQPALTTPEIRVTLEQQDPSITIEGERKTVPARCGRRQLLPPRTACRLPRPHPCRAHCRNPHRTSRPARCPNYSSNSDSKTDSRTRRRISCRGFLLCRTSSSAS
jgi:uncharacterized OB-fold protein